MSQTRTQSAIETIVSTVIGYLVAYLTQVAVFPIFGFHARTREHLAIGAIFTVVSLIRGYFVRRLFNWIHHGIRP